MLDFDQLPLLRDAVLATDLSFTISDPRQDDNPLVWVNPAFTRMTGYSYQEVVGRNCRILQGAGTLAEHVRPIHDALAAGTAVTQTLLNYRKDGTAFWNQLSISPVFDAEGRLANHVGVQLDVTERVRTEDERERAHAAERRARDRLSLLAAVSDQVADLDGPTALRRLAHLLSRDLVQWCVVVLTDRDLQVVAASGLPSDDLLGASMRLQLRAALVGPSVVEEVRPLHDLAGALLEGPVGAAVTLDLHRPPEGSVTAWLARLLEHRITGPVMAVPVGGRRDVLGLVLVGPRGEQLDDDDAGLLGEAVRRAGLALDNARLYAREHALAETLQRSMLPEQATVPGLDVWTYYAPSAEHAQVGGDWYDVMQPAAGTAAIVVGDVVGHDVEAAAAMGQLRSVVRSYAFERLDPGTVLMRVDQLAHGMRIPRMASLVYTALRSLGADEADDGRPGAWEMSWSSAGHLPGLLRRDAQVTQLDGAEGTLIGLGDWTRSTAQRQVGAGDVLVLYTDGLVERRGRGLAEGIDVLREALLGSTAHTASGIGEELLAALGDSPDDDTAVVVVRFPDQGTEGAATGASADDPAPRLRRYRLAPVPASISRARHATTRAVHAWGLPVAAAAELVASELVANAVLHGSGPVGLQLSVREGVLRLEVSDANLEPPRRVSPRSHGEGGHGLHVVEHLARWGWEASPDGKTVWAEIHSDADLAL